MSENARSLSSEYSFGQPDTAHGAAPLSKQFKLSSPTKQSRSLDRHTSAFWISERIKKPDPHSSDGETLQVSLEVYVLDVSRVLSKDTQMSSSIDKNEKF